jgi:hypothetical protein
MEEIGKNIHFDIIKVEEVADRYREKREGLKKG